MKWPRYLFGCAGGSTKAALPDGTRSSWPEHSSSDASLTPGKRSWMEENRDGALFSWVSGCELVPFASEAAGEAQLTGEQRNSSSG